MNEFLKKDKELIWHPFTPLQGGVDPILIKSGNGVYLNTADDKKIIDAVSSWWVNLHGHANPVIAKAIADQAQILEHVIFAGFTHPQAITLAENLLNILPSNQSKIFFSDNGSTAVEVALKMAIQYWNNKEIKKERIIALDGAYHGDTFGAMSVGERGMFTNPFHALLFDVDVIDLPSFDNESDVLHKFENLVRSRDVAAFIFEPLLQGAAGMRTYPAEILDKLIRIAKSFDTLCIADEVLTGFGRTGKMFACDYLVEKPDIMAISKGITGGAMALGVTSCSNKIVEAFDNGDFTKTFFHGHSYTANPLACAAANASYSILVDQVCQNEIKMITESHTGFVKRMKDHDKVRNARSLGTMVAIELEVKGETSYTSEIRKRIYPFFIERNILLRPLGNTIYILPPYLITAEELETIYKAIEEFVASI
ncbi:MAG: adenosylmethionine--8-amino-7-oxononanoate transaminase [Chryseolinea sp.]